MGGNSFFGKMAAYDPLNKFANSIQDSPFGKVLNYADPVRDPTNPTKSLAQSAVQAGNEYSNRNNVSGYPNPTPYAGVQPTLQDANNGYVQAAQRVAQQQQQQQQQRQQQQSPWGG